MKLNAMDLIEGTSSIYTAEVAFTALNLLTGNNNELRHTIK